MTNKYHLMVHIVSVSRAEASEVSSYSLYTNHASDRRVQVYAKLKLIRNASPLIGTVDAAAVSAAAEQLQQLQNQNARSQARNIHMYS